MRDDSKRWDAPRAMGAAITAEGLAITPLSLPRQTLISGAQVLRQLGGQYGAPSGWPDIASGTPYALALRRDRVLLVDGPQMADGWDAATGWAISDMSGAYMVFELTGPRAMGLLRRGTEISLARPSASVARPLFGLGTLLYRHGDGETFRIHVARGHGEALWKAFETCLGI